MYEKQKKQTLSLAVIMVICVVLTSLLLSDSLQCSDCGKKITGKYYVSLSDRPYCKDCGAEYYRGFPGDLDNITDRVDNTARNILVIVEMIGFIGAMFVVNKKNVEKITTSDDGIRKFEKKPIMEDVKEKFESATRKEILWEQKRKIEQEDKVVKTYDTKDKEINDEKSEGVEVKSKLRSSFKSKAEEAISTSSQISAEGNNGDWFKTAGDL